MEAEVPGFEESLLDLVEVPDCLRVRPQGPGPDRAVPPAARLPQYRRDGRGVDGPDAK